MTSMLSRLWMQSSVKDNHSFILMVCQQVCVCKVWQVLEMMIGGKSDKAECYSIICVPISIIGELIYILRLDSDFYQRQHVIYTMCIMISVHRTYEIVSMIMESGWYYCTYS